MHDFRANIDKKAKFYMASGIIIISICNFSILSTNLDISIIWISCISMIIGMFGCVRSLSMWAVRDMFDAGIAVVEKSDDIRRLQRDIKYLAEIDAKRRDEEQLRRREAELDKLRQARLSSLSQSHTIEGIRSLILDRRAVTIDAMLHPVGILPRDLSRCLYEIELSSFTRPESGGKLWISKVDVGTVIVDSGQYPKFEKLVLTALCAKFMIADDKTGNSTTRLLKLVIVFDPLKAASQVEA